MGSDPSDVWDMSGREETSIVSTSIPKVLN